MNSYNTERDKFTVPRKISLSKITDVSTFTSTCSTEILLWVPNAVPIVNEIIENF